MNPITQPAADALAQMVSLGAAALALSILIPGLFAIVRLLTRP